jgi:hypothetical protein
MSCVNAYQMISWRLIVQTRPQCFTPNGQNLGDNAFPAAFLRNLISRRAEA